MKPAVYLTDRAEMRRVRLKQPRVTSTQGNAQPERLRARAKLPQRLWFQPLTGLQLGHPCALTFYRDLDEVAVFHTHVANFVKDTTGTALPTDLILVRADRTLQRGTQPWLGGI